MTATAVRHTGLIGLAVMGENLALNIERNGFPLAVYNRTYARTEEFLSAGAKGRNIVGAATVEEFVSLIEKPRRIIIMVKAGAPVDAVLAELRPYLDPDDIVIDGGNSLFTDTARRTIETENAFRFMGMGISGGEEGALNGPSLMPGGPRDAYEIIEPMLVAIAAKTEAGPCVTYIGPGGAGHYVKMVHNGIEYADMQLIAETYDLLGRALGLTAPEIGEVFGKWNEGRLASYLVEITAEVLATIDRQTGGPLVDVILDTAEQKGTGRWTSHSALDLGSPIPAIDAAVFARSMSSRKAAREAASLVLYGPSGAILATNANRQATIDSLENALYFAKISSYAQGMALLAAASAEYDWNLRLAEIARIWKGGCIIRAALLDPIRAAYKENPEPANLLLAPFFSEAMNENAPFIRQAVATAVQMGIPVPALSASLTYVDTWRTPRLPANVLQALRDNFGAHTYRRLDREGIFHTTWASGETEQVG
ncbi:MAG: NADP-dependent phosphogluconate dehydrogenase [Thermomicrobiales bacterium]